MKNLALLMAAMVLACSFASGCSKPLPTADELSQRKAADDAKRTEEPE